MMWTSKLVDLPKVMITALIICTFPAKSLLSTVRGREFYLAFFSLDSYASTDSIHRNVYVFISNPTDSTVQVTLRFESLELSGSVVTIGAQETEKCELPDELILSGSLVHQTHAVLTSEDDVLVEAFMDFDSDSQMGMASYMVLPTASLSTRYIAATHCADNNCYILVTSVENDNNVRLALRIKPSNSMATFQGNFYGDDAVITNMLQKGESILLTCLQCDMTGTEISADHKVTVVGGGDYTLYNSNRGFRDIVAEQMMPAELLGTRYLLGSNFDNLFQILKIVVIDAHASFLFQGIWYTSSRVRDVFVVESHEGSLFWDIQAEDSILIVQVLAGRTHEDYPDTSMILPLPFERWYTEYEVYLPMGSDSAYVCLLAPVGTKVTFPPWSDETEVTTVSSNYQMITVSFQSTGLMTIRCQSGSSCQPFSGFVMANKRFRSSACALISGKSSNIDETTTVTQADTARPITDETTVFTVGTTPTSTLTSTTARAATLFSKTNDPNNAAPQTQPAVQETTNLQVDVTTTPEEDATSSEVSVQENTSPAVLPQPGQSTAALTVQEESTITNEESTLSTDVTTPNPQSTAPGQQPSTPRTTNVFTDVTTPQSPSTATRQSSTSGNCDRCRCVQNKPQQDAEQRSQEAQRASEAIRIALLEDPRAFSSYSRSKTSSPDDRTSSTIIGTTLSIALVGGVFGFLAVADVFRFVNCIRMYLRRRN